ncbi:MAG: gamma-glutamylcysteine synthetase, partial [Deltaproteobacteria bacterium]
ATLASYTEYALDVPMYFIQRDGAYIDLTGKRFSFRRYVAEGWEGHRATLADWDLHLSTLFTEVRLRPQIEIRTADALPEDLTLSVSGLLKGLFYCREAAEEAMDLLYDGDFDDLQQSYLQSWRLGLKTVQNGRPLAELAPHIVDLALEGLRRQQNLNDRGLDETVFLDPVRAIAEEGVTLAERLLAGWSGDRRKDLEMIKRHCAFGQGS